MGSNNHRPGNRAVSQEDQLPARLIVALDYSDPGRAADLVKRLSPLGVGFKVGLELYMAGGAQLVAALSSENRVFLDLKFHDIPNTVAAAVKAASALNIWMLNVHAAGGRKMLEAARRALYGFKNRPLLVAVTVLTSMDESEMVETGCTPPVAARVERLARLASECDLDGVVCSPLEIEPVKAAIGNSFLTVTPGIRPGGEALHDQVRVATPAGVISSGGDYLVVGRPVTGAEDPFASAQAILHEMQRGLKNCKPLEQRFHQKRGKLT